MNELCISKCSKYNTNMYCCGFNGFHQIVEDDNCIASFKWRLLKIDNVKDLDFSWSSFLAICDDSIIMSGYCQEAIHHMKRIEKPPDIQFSSLSCGDETAVFVTNEGKCWQLRYADEEWKELLDFTLIEQEVQNDPGNGNQKDRKEHETQNISTTDSSVVQAKGIKKICCGEIVNIALDHLGRVYSVPSPIPMPGIKIVDVACGFEHSVMLDDIGRVYTMGSGMRGQLGNEVLETAESPQEVNALGGLNVVKISAGGWHSAAVTQCGVLYTWGWNNSGQLGFAAPKESDNLILAEGWTGQRDDLFCGVEKSDDDDDVKSCEKKKSGSKHHLQDDEEFYSELYKRRKTTNKPVGQTEVLSSPTREKSPEKNSVADVYPESLHSNRKQEASQNSQSEESGNSDCSDDTVSVLAVPKPVDFPSDINVVSVGCGNRHTVVLAGDGSVWGCGWNFYGQLSQPPKQLITTDTMIKLDVPTGKVKAIYCGAWNTALIME